VVVPTREGIAEFTDLLIDQAADGYRLIAEVSQLASDTSSSFSMAAPRPFEQSVIAASTASTCALDPSGAAWCWGDNVVGQLGEGRLFSSPTPVAIVGNLRFSQITVQPGYADAINDNDGLSIACGLTVDGRIYCWGGLGSAFDNGDGSTPTLISGLGRLCRSARIFAACAVSLRVGRFGAGDWEHMKVRSSSRPICALRHWRSAVDTTADSRPRGKRIAGAPACGATVSTTGAIPRCQCPAITCFGRSPGAKGTTVASMTRASRGAGVGRSTRSWATIAARQGRSCPCVYPALTRSDRSARCGRAPAELTPTVACGVGETR
jgi:hypothetical protein